MRNKWRGKSKMQNKQREREHSPIDAETFEEWRANFMKDQTDEGELRGNIATAVIGG